MSEPQKHEAPGWNQPSGPGVQSGPRRGTLASSAGQGPLQGWTELWLRMHAAPPDSQVLALGRGMDRQAERTHREVCIEVVLPVKQGLPVDVTVQGQAGHHGRFHTPPVEDLQGQDTHRLNKCASPGTPSLDLRSHPSTGMSSGSSCGQLSSQANSVCLRSGK